MKSTDENNELYLRISSEITKCRKFIKANDQYIADYLHDAFIKVMEKYKEKYQEKGKLEAWVRKVAHNHIITRINQEKKHKHLYIDDLNIKNIINSKSNNKEIKRKIVTEYVISALDTLPQIDYEIITRKSQDLPDIRIADELNLNVKTVKKHIAKSYKAMGEFVNNKYLEENNEPLNYNDL